MRKFLLSMLAVVGLGAIASAQTATITNFPKDNFTANADKTVATGTLTAEDKTEFPCQVEKGTYNSDMTAGLAYSPFRLYKGTNFVFNAPQGKKFERIEFSFVSGYAKGFKSVTENPVGTFGTVANNAQTWTAPAEGATSCVCVNAEAQTRFSKIVVYFLSDDPNFVAAPVFNPEGGTYYEAQNVTITAGEGCEIHYTLDGTQPTATSNKYTAAIPVAKNTTIKAIAVKGENVSEVTTAEYIIKEMPTYESIEKMKTITDDALEFVVGCDLTIGFRNASNIFVTDGKDWIQIYGNLPATLVAGSKINKGWKAKYKLYDSTTPELLPVAVASVTGVEGSFTPGKVDASKVTVDLVNSVITIPDVVFAEATPSTKTNFEGKVGDVTLSFRNNYLITGVDAGTYDVTVVVIIFNKATSLYVIKYDSKSGIEDVTVDNNAPVEYYNMQGVKISEPQAGQIVLRRQGSKVTKIVK